MLGVVAASVTGIVLVTAVIAIAEGSLDVPRLGVPAAISFVSAVIVSNLVLLAITLARTDPGSLVLLVLPAVVALLAFRAYVAQARRLGRLLDTFVGHASVMLENGRLERSLAEVTDLKERLRHQAFHDPLTGLPNRRLLTERVEAALSRSSDAAAVLFLDLDDFKAINDTLGHAAGDEVLVEVGRRIARCIRSGDTAARLGGDEFAVLLESIDRRGTEVVAESLLRAMRRPFELSGREAAINASIGIAPAAGGGSADELLRNADVAMYSAKETGKHRFAHYDPSLHAKGASSPRARARAPRGARP
jgi:diguanylate cyclase (GGDEF)-like protein